LVVAGAFTSVLTASAFGADLPTHKTPPAPIPVALPYNWTGCYIGGNVGGLWADKNFGSIQNYANNSENGPSLGDGQNVQGTGVLIGGQVGCNCQVGQWVFGAQVDEDWTNASGSGTQSYGYLAQSGVQSAATVNASQSLYSYNLTNHFQVNSLGSASARVGWAFDRFLPYIKGGVGWETVNYNESLNYGASFGWSQSWGETLVGWTVGGGFEYAFTDHLTAFAEGDYYDFGSKDLNACFLSSSCISYANYSRNVNETDWVGKVGLNWKF
jgi:outer membrane immunogenic protein